MDYRSFKDLPRGAASDKVLRDNGFDIAKNIKYDGYQYDGYILLQRFVTFLMKNLLLLHSQRTYLREINLLPVVVLKMKICQTKN